MKFFVCLSVLLFVVVLVQSFEETRIGPPAGFAFNLLPLQDIIPMTQFENLPTKNLKGFPEHVEKSKSGGFFPLLRVGRSGNFHNPSASKKAAKMTVFPRVGRDSPSVYAANDCDDRHSTRDTSSGLWFGPRLGVHKRDDYELPLSYILLNGGHGTRMEYIPFQDKDFDSDDDSEKLDFGTFN